MEAESKTSSHQYSTQLKDYGDAIIVKISAYSDGN
jgi:hypothetical protein